LSTALFEFDGPAILTFVTWIANRQILHKSDRHVRWVRVDEDGPLAQYHRHLSVKYFRPRKRNKEGLSIYPDGLQFFTITIESVPDAVLFDSRKIFPVDCSGMDAASIDPVGVA
jgi:hypothetical protein